MRLGFVSDTHNHHANKWGIEPCDIIVHSGDFSFYGRDTELRQFFQDAKKAMKDAEASYFIVVPGNHEKGVQANECLFREQCKEHDIIPLIHDSIEIEGIKFFGTPWQPDFCNWAYNTNDIELIDYYAEIPDDTKVLITHCPPHMMLDYSPMCGNVGSKPLWNRVQQMLGTLKYHSFGHIHYSHGIKEFMGTKFINAAILTDHYNLNPAEKRMIVLDY